MTPRVDIAVLSNEAARRINKSRPDSGRRSVDRQDAHGSRLGVVVRQTEVSQAIGPARPDELGLNLTSFTFGSP